jgi:hypothetical protein
MQKMKLLLNHTSFYGTRIMYEAHPLSNMDRELVSYRYFSSAIDSNAALI